MPEGKKPAEDLYSAKTHLHQPVPEVSTVNATALPADAPEGALPSEVRPEIVTWDKLVEAIKASGKAYNMAMIEKAYNMANDAHKGVCRRSGEPYICHPLAVARLVLDLGMDTESLAAALLQDLIGLAELDAQIDDRHDASRRHAEDAAGRRVDETAGLFEHQVRAAEAEDHADHGLIDLADGRRGHVALPLEEAAVGRDDADEQHARRQRRDGRPGVFIRRDHDRQLAAEHEHDERADDADGQKDLHGHRVDLADLRVIVERLRL